MSFTSVFVLSRAFNTSTIKDSTDYRISEDNTFMLLEQIPKKREISIKILLLSQTKDTSYQLIT